MKLSEILLNATEKQVKNVYSKSIDGETCYCALGLLLKKAPNDFSDSDIMYKKDFLENKMLNLGFDIKLDDYLMHDGDKIYLGYFLTTLNDNYDLSFKEIGSILQSLDL